MTQATLSRPEAKRPKARDRAAQIRNFVGGEFREPASGRYLENIEPATGKTYSFVADSDGRDVEQAVAAAELFGPTIRVP